MITSLIDTLSDIPWQGWAAVTFLAITTGVFDFLKWRADRKRQEYREF